MNVSISKKFHQKSGLLDGLVISFGFFPIAMAFGIVAKDFGFSFLEATMCSIMVFAGASQFAAVGLLISGGTIFDVIVLVWLMNMRHFLMGMSLMAIHGKRLVKYKPLLGFGLTDESYTYLSLSKKDINSRYAILFQSMTYLAWISGTVSGFLLGEYMPIKLSQSLDIALYGMFAALASVAIKGNPNNLKIILFSGTLHYLLSHFEIFNSSWNLIAAMIIASILGAKFLSHEMTKRRKL